MDELGLLEEDVKLGRNMKRVFRWWILLFLLLTLWTPGLRTVSLDYAVIAGLAGMSWLGVGGVICACFWRKATLPKEREAAAYRFVMCLILSLAACGWGISFSSSAFLLWLFGTLELHPVAHWTLIGVLALAGITLLVVVTPILLVRASALRRRRADDLKEVGWPMDMSWSNWDVRLFAVLLFITCVSYFLVGNVGGGLAVIVFSLIVFCMPTAVAKIAVRLARGK